MPEFLAEPRPAGRDRRGSDAVGGFVTSLARPGRQRHSMPCYHRGNAMPTRRVFDALRSAACNASTRWATAATARASLLNLVYNPQGPSLPPPQAALEADLQARARRQLRRRVQPALHARQHADPALRLDADFQGRVRLLPRHAAARASRRQPRRRDVPQSASRSTGAATSTTATSTRCSTCRWRSGARDGACICPKLADRLTTFDGNPIRVAGIASAAPPARDRAAAAR